MRFFVQAFLLFSMSVAIVFGQESDRNQKLRKIAELNSQIKVLETDVLQPAVEDLKQAEKEGFEVFRLMPRELYDHKLTVQGGGSYYSFTTRSHDYQKIAQIGLEQSYLKSGFAGADYGLIADLGNVPLAGVTKETDEINFLVNYISPTAEAEIRIEQRKAYNYETEKVTYKSRVSVSIGHCYALRAISFDAADVLVAFRVHRKDSDGSLIVFWKLLENFETPKIIRSEQASAARNVSFVPAVFSENPAAKIEAALRKKGFKDVKVDVSTVPMTLRGTVPKGKLAEVIYYIVQDNSGGKPVRNELTEK